LFSLKRSTEAFGATCDPRLDQFSHLRKDTGQKGSGVFPTQPYWNGV